MILMMRLALGSKMREHRRAPIGRSTLGFDCNLRRSTLGSPKVYIGITKVYITLTAISEDHRRSTLGFDCNLTNYTFDK